jgi:hypothetical protein
MEQPWPLQIGSHVHSPAEHTPWLLHVTPAYLSAVRSSSSSSSSSSTPVQGGHAREAHNDPLLGYSYLA